MLIKPYADDLWFRFPKRHNPDADILNFVYNKGDFSLRTYEAFNKHINKLNGLANNPFFCRFNGKRIKMILQQEALWY